MSLSEESKSRDIAMGEESILCINEEEKGNKPNIFLFIQPLSHAFGKNKQMLPSDKKHARKILLSNTLLMQVD